jgi:hypothetical protein
MTWSKKDRFRTVVISGVLLVAGTPCSLSFLGAADSAETKLFDPPVSIRRIPAKSPGTREARLFAPITRIS